MRKNSKKLFALGFAIILLLCSAFSASAANDALITADLSKVGTFVAMGDLNCDNLLNSADLVLLRKALLQEKEQDYKYADAKEDGSVNILDLVRLKKNIIAEKTPVSIKDGVLTLNGNAYYTGEFVSLLNENTEYQISYYATSDDGITVSINGATNNAVTYNSGKNAAKKYCSHVFKTSSVLTANSGLELKLSGEGTIYNIVINEITNGWTDSDNSEQGSNDIF